MKLLSNSYKKLGWILFLIFFLPSVFIWITEWEPGFLDVKVPTIFSTDVFTFKDGKLSFKAFEMAKNNLANEICSFFFLSGMLLLIFSQEKDEDEYIMKIRLDSFLKATLINGFIILGSIVFIYDFFFFYIMTLNLVLFFLIYIIRFEWILWKRRREVE